MNNENSILKRPVLVVDDNQTIAEIIAEFLSGNGFENVVKATNVPDAIEIIKTTQEKFSLIVTDLELGNQNGLEISAMSRRVSPETKVILVTGNPEPNLLGIARQADLDAIIFKPDFLEPLGQELKRMGFLGQQPAESMTA